MQRTNANENFDGIRAPNPVRRHLHMLRPRVGMKQVVVSAYGV